MIQNRPFGAVMLTKVSAPISSPINRCGQTFMNGIPIVFSVTLALLVAVATAGDAGAQHHAKKGLQIGMKVGVSSYSGDIDVVLPGESNFDLTLEGELFYRFSRWFGIGVKQSYGNYPTLSATEGQRNSTAIAIRSYLLKKRLSPYIQVGASRSSGGSEAGYGVALATGFELEVSRYIALFQDISFDQVLPDVALDGLSGGRKYDLFGRLGGGIRVNLVKSKRGFDFVRVDQADSIMVGEVGQFAAVLQGIDPADVRYKWDLPGGVTYTENPIRHSFSNSGSYEMNLTVTSKNEIVREVVLVNVFRPEVVDTVETEDISSKAVRISSISGSETIDVGAEGAFRMRIETGAAWPIQYQWDMGDGSMIVGNYVVHRYESPGVYRVRGEASNSFGKDSREMTVEVSRSLTPVIGSDWVEESVPVATTEPQDETRVATDTPETNRDTTIGNDEGVSGSSGETDDSETDLSVTDTKRTPVAAPNPERNVSRIDPDKGGFSWVVESLKTAAGAATRAEDYKYLGFPYGYKLDAETGLHNVMVGQFESEWVALKVSWRIQQHAPRRIWLSPVK